MTQRALLRDTRGMTLAEILVAVAIVALGLGALMAIVPVASFGVQEGNQVSTATFLAQQRLEQVRAAAWTANPANDCVGLSADANSAPVPAGTTCNGLAAPTFPDEPAGGVPGYPGYARTVRVTDCGVAPGCGLVVHPALRLVTVTVSFRPLTGAGVATNNTSVNLEWLVTQR